MSTSKQVEVIRSEIKNDIFTLLDKMDAEQLLQTYNSVIPTFFNILHNKRIIEEPKNEHL